MLRKWRQRWGLTAAQSVVVLLVFAITGTLTAWLARTITGWLGLDATDHWALRLAVRLAVLVFAYPFILLTVGVIAGQGRFFILFLKKMIGIKKKQEMRKPVPVAVFASGSGSNAEALWQYFKQDGSAAIALIVCNKKDAGVVEKAAAWGVPVLHIEKERFFKEDGYLPELHKAGIQFLVLAGFLWKVPAVLIRHYPQSIVNIHPALLPRHGGKGMWGQHVHEAVLAAGDAESGITIHYVDEQYDHGHIIFQARCAVLPTDNAQTLAQRVLELEHRWYPKIVAQIVSNNSV